jgi:transcriptional regulator with XRE-family HTH domain
MRKRSGLTIEDLGRKSRLSPNAISRLERDHSRAQPWALGRILPHFAAQFEAVFPETNGDAYDLIIPPVTFGSWLKNQRLRRGMKLNELAQQLNVRPFTLIRYESDQRKPQAPILDRLKRVLKLSDLPVILPPAGI